MRNSSPQCGQASGEEFTEEQLFELRFAGAVAVPRQNTGQRMPTHQGQRSGEHPGSCI